MGNFQFDLITATIRSQNIITDKQTADATGGVVANAILQTEYGEATVLLNNDQLTTVDDSPTSSGTWNTSESEKFSINNANYQNDAAVAQTGETNASTAVQQQQTAVSTDSTNLYNLVSLAQTLIQIGSYTANLINTAYT